MEDLLYETLNGSADLFLDCIGSRERFRVWR
jgi:hypothetical protein